MRALLLAAVLACAAPLHAAAPAIVATHGTTAYRTVTVDGLTIFYREAGPVNAPTLLLLHGFPTSSRMFETLLPLLADRYHLVAPDYVGFGHSDAPPPDHFAYTFEHLAQVVDGFTQTLHLDRYALFLQDFGGPVGFRLALAHPERVTAVIVQNAVAHEEGLNDKTWAARREYWKDRAAHEAELRANLLSLDVTRARHVGSSPHPERYDPDLWTDELAFLSRPGEIEIQLDLFYDYRTNLAAYPSWQAYLREHKPPTLVVWGRYDPSFTVAGGEAYRRDVPEAEVHILDAGHFALDEAVGEIAGYVRHFLDRRVARR